MNIYFVVNRPRDWPFDIPGVTTVTARAYLTDPTYSDQRAARVLNLCRTERYQSRGYYVSLLAEARGHQPLPGVKAIEDLQAEDPAHLIFGDLREQIRQALASCARAECTINAYFGRDPTCELDALAQQLFELFQTPLLRATLVRRGNDWGLVQAKIMSADQIPVEHREFAARAAADYIVPHRARAQLESQDCPAIAILHNQDVPDPPSNARAIQKFCDVGRAMGMRVEILRRGDIERLPDFDALFIRDTTWINHYTYQFARRATTEGLVVIDDPESILRCNNKVFLHELLTRHRIPIPRTLMVHRENVDQIVPMLGLPCIIKQPDSAFSLGVTKIQSKDELTRKLAELFAKSDLLIAQQWLPTAFDWRVGIIDRRVLYVCKYLMAPGHWQVIKREADRKLEGSTLALSIGEAPDIVVKTALRAANLIGDGFYGVDLKQTEDQCYVIEVNDNPNVDAGNEDGVLKDALYREVLGVLMRRVQERRGGIAR